MVFLIHIISHVTHKYADYFPKQKGLRHSKLQLDKKPVEIKTRNLNYLNDKSPVLNVSNPSVVIVNPKLLHWKAKPPKRSLSKWTELLSLLNRRSRKGSSEESRRSSRGLFLILTCPSSVRYHQCGVLLLHDRSYIRSSPLLHCNIDNT